MLKIGPAISANIERLSTKARNMVGLNRHDSSLLHVVDDVNLKPHDKIVRYNVRQADGTIKKYTLMDYFIKEVTLRNSGDGYKKVSTKRYRV